MKAFILFAALVTLGGPIIETCGFLPVGSSCRAARVGIIDLR